MWDYLFSWATFLEIFGVVSGFCVLWLELKQRPSMWILNMICSLLYIAVYLHAHIYAKTAFNVYYVVMSIYGLLMWRRSLSTHRLKEKGEKKVIEYVHLSLRSTLFYLLASVFLFAFIYWILLTFTPSHSPVADALSTTLNVVGTYILTKRVIEVWVVWMLENAISLYLYLSTGLYLTMLLYTCYLLASFWGYYNWKRNGIRVEGKE